MKNSTSILYACITLFLLACQTGNNQPEKHKDLAGFTITGLAEPGDKNFDSLYNEMIKEKITVYSANGITDISVLAELNACGIYEGNINISGDTLYLKLRQTNDEVCTSVDMNKLTYLVANPTEKKYTIVNQVYE